MTWSVRVAPAAQRRIRKLDPQAARRIRSFLEQNLEGIDDPRALGKPLIEQAFWRYRVGDYRIIASLEDRILTMLLVAVAHRREVYRDL